MITYINLVINVLTNYDYYQTFLEAGVEAVVREQNALKIN